MTGVRVAPNGLILRDGEVKKWQSALDADGQTVWLERDGPAHVNDTMILERLSLALAIRDDQGNDLPDYQCGRICLRGPSVMSGYFQALSSYTIDDTVQLGIVRNGSRSSLRIRLAGIPPSYAREFAYQWLGIEVQQVSPAVQRNYRLFAEEGVVITKVLPNGPCGQVGIQPGDVIRRVNRDTIRTQEDYEKAVMEAGKLSSVVLLVQRGRSGYYVTLEP